MRQSPVKERSHPARPPSCVQMVSCCTSHGWGRGPNSSRSFPEMMVRVYDDDGGGGGDGGEDNELMMMVIKFYTP